MNTEQRKALLEDKRAMEIELKLVEFEKTDGLWLAKWRKLRELSHREQAARDMLDQTEHLIKAEGKEE